jgi:hypothetical protein
MAYILTFYLSIRSWGYGSECSNRGGEDEETKKDEVS